MHTGLFATHALSKQTSRIWWVHVLNVACTLLTIVTYTRGMWPLDNLLAKRDVHGMSDNWEFQSRRGC